MQECPLRSGSADREEIGSLGSLPLTSNVFLLPLQLQSLLIFGQSTSTNNTLVMLSLATLALGALPLVAAQSANEKVLGVYMFVSARPYLKNR